MKPFLAENRQLYLLALPLIVNYIVEACPIFINNVMIAHLGQQAFAAGAIVSNAFSSLLLFFYGILVAASVLISHQVGAKNTKPIGNIVRDAGLLSLFFSGILLLFLGLGPELLREFGQSPALVAIATPYIHGLMFAVIPDLISMVLWQFFLGLGKPKVTLISSLLYVPISIGAKYILMFGHLGFPALGMLGIGLGTAVGFWLLTLGLIAYILCHHAYRGYFYQWLKPFDRKHINPLIKIGFPMGAMWTIDVSFIMIVSLLVGSLNTTLLAAQQISLQALSFVMFIVGGLSQAISIRMGHTLGAKAYDQTAIIGFTGLINSVMLALLCSLVFWLKPLWIIGMDFNVHDPRNAMLIHLASDMLTIFGCYLLANSLRYAAFAILRAFKDTYFSALCSLLGFYGIALGLGYPWLFHWGGSVTQFWYLATLAVVLMAVAMCWRFVIKNRALRRDDASGSPAGINVVTT